MKIKEIRDNSEVYSTKLSDSCRQLCFAGIAIVWIFKVGTDTAGITYDGKLIYPLGAFALALLMEIAQYTYGTFAWKSLGDSMDKEKLAEKAVKSNINCITYLFFKGKVFFVICGYLIILFNIGSQI